MASSETNSGHCIKPGGDKDAFRRCPCHDQRSQRDGRVSRLVRQAGDEDGLIHLPDLRSPLLVTLDSSGRLS